MRLYKKLKGDYADVLGLSSYSTGDCRKRYGSLVDTDNRFPRLAKGYRKVSNRVPTKDVVAYTYPRQLTNGHCAVQPYSAANCGCGYSWVVAKLKALGANGWKIDLKK